MTSTSSLTGSLSVKAWNKGLAESFEAALELADGLAVTEYADAPEGQAPERIIFSANFACPVSGFTIPEIEPRLFSFNNPFGACPTCDGLGEQLKIDPELIVPERDKSLQEGAIAPWAKSTSPYQTQTLQALAKAYKFKMSVKWAELSENVHQIILNGTDGADVPFVYDDGMRRYEVKKPFEGVIPNLERRWRETDSAWVRDEIAKFQSAQPCPACKGKRLKPEALAVKIGGMDISDATSVAIRDANKWFETAEDSLTPQKVEIASRILKEIRDRLKFLNDVGLDYLNLSRASGTLSGGESQRIRLASQIGSGLTGVLYVLDEPSIGLHQRDNERLLETLRRLRDLGNSVIVVEHDEDAILAADYVIDMGPAAGIHGGEIVSQGTPEEVIADPKSLTGAYLSGMREIPVPERRRWSRKTKSVKLIGARGNNLKDVTVEIPLGTFHVCYGCIRRGKVHTHH